MQKSTQIARERVWWINFPCPRAAHGIAHTALLQSAPTTNLNSIDLFRCNDKESKWRLPLQEIQISKNWWDTELVYISGGVGSVLWM